MSQTNDIKDEALHDENLRDENLRDENLRDRGLGQIGTGKTLVIACGALAREVLAIIEMNRLAHLTLTCLPAILHNDPSKIPAAATRPSS